MKCKRVIKTPKELPAWFDIRRYDAAHYLDLQGWAREIYLRSVYRDVLRNGKRWGWERRDLEDTLRSWLKGLQENPILPLYDYCDIQEFAAFQKWKTQKPYEGYSVRSLDTFSGWISGQDLEREDLGVAVAEALAACQAEEQGRATEEQQQLCELPYDLILQRAGISNEGLYNIVVDLFATDEQLLSDFKHWLTKFRKVADIPAPAKNFTEGNFRDWHRSGILPYFDLTFWAEIEGVHITLDALGDGIFPGWAGNVASRIGKVTKPKADRVFSTAFAEALDRQAAAERIAGLPEENRAE
jgi:hypothetical protein